MKPPLTTVAMALPLLFALCPTEAVFSQPRGASVAASGPRVEIPETQLLKVTSSGQEYLLYVHLPEKYSETTRTYPALYLLDAQWDFPLMVGLTDSLSDDGWIPPMIVVGITWGGKNPDYGYLRFRDLTPANGARFPQSGNGPKFLRFLEKELIPLIESKYRTSRNDRTLLANSLGGLFGLYSLFTEPSLFRRYVLSSPTLGFAGGIAPFEAKYASTATDLPVRLFLAVGDVEGPHIGQIQELVASLKSRHYRDLELETLIVKSAGHSSNKPEGFVKGLQAVFAPKLLAIEEAVLDRYVGKYQFPGWTVEIVREKGNLFFIVPEGTRFLLNPETKEDFYTRGMYMVVHFKSNEAGKIVGMDAEQPGSRRFVEKIS